ncbi:hypothetical protein [Actinomadura sp. DC4]|uniref:hypothetical protein n=1 Tax=Actinomadura sp. DC4 TaxID=3055069 RepID=UPI0025B139F7|nr:hypothetical protein [Actinomadura sp. DC4]MDN3356853.1 hypothetical protein [Actinomadura sp. DC4]
MAEWRLDPNTFALTEEGRPRPGGYTWEEFQDVGRPPCPTCGTPINVSPVKVEAMGDPEPRYVPGLMSCPNRCEPRRP